MGRKRHSAEEVINKLQQADGELGKSNTVAGVCRLLGHSDSEMLSNYYHLHHDDESEQSIKALAEGAEWTAVPVCEPV